MAPQVTAHPASCLSRYLGARSGLSQGTAGSTYTVIDFTNLSNFSCTLHGTAAESHTTPRELVTLAPGGVANALLRLIHAGDYPVSKCHPATADYLLIYPPNQAVPTDLPVLRRAGSSASIQILTVSVVQPGTGGSS
jgi:hypothetical protein